MPWVIVTKGAYRTFTTTLATGRSVTSAATCRARRAVSAATSAQSERLRW